MNSLQTSRASFACVGWLVCAACAVAQTRPVEAPAGIPHRPVVNYTYTATPTSHAIQPAVGLVLFSEHAAETQQQLREDLTVLAHLLSKKTNSVAAPLSDRMTVQPKQVSAMGIAIRGVDSRRAEVRYIEGIGVMIKIPVHYALTAFKDDQHTDGPAEPESEWERAKREVYVQNILGTDGRLVGSNSGDATRRSYLLSRAAGNLSGNLRSLHVDAFNAARHRRFDEETVQRVQHDLIAAIDAARHVRHLQPEDHIIIRILETPAQGQVDGRTVMNVRVRMSDVLRASEGELDPKFVEVFRYVEG